MQLEIIIEVLKTQKRMCDTYSERKHCYDCPWMVDGQEGCIIRRESSKINFENLAKKLRMWGEANPIVETIHIDGIKYELTEGEKKKTIEFLKNFKPESR